MATIVPLPDIASWPRLQWTPQFRNQANKSAWSGNRKVMGLPGGESFAVSAAPKPAYTAADERKWIGFVMALRGTENHFYLPFAKCQFAVGTPNPAVQSAVAGNSFATLTGIPAGGLKLGMGLTFSLTTGYKQLVVVTADVAAGTQAVPFEPSLRSNAAGAVEAINPYAEVALTSDKSGWTVDQGGFTIGFDAEEAWGD
jgi:hypothetical protein